MAMAANEQAIARSRQRTGQPPKYRVALGDFIFCAASKQQNNQERTAPLHVLKHVCK